MFFPEATVESLDKKHWDEKLLKVYFFILFGCLIIF